LVVLRKTSDLRSVSSFLRERSESPHLIIASLNLIQNPSTKFAVELKSTPIDRETCAKILAGFDFELVSLDYKGDRLSASVFAEECSVRKCDSVIVVSDGKKQLYAPDLASTLAVESTAPVIVIKS